MNAAGPSLCDCRPGQLFAGKSLQWPSGNCKRSQDGAFAIGQALNCEEGLVELCGSAATDCATSCVNLCTFVCSRLSAETTQHLLSKERRAAQMHDRLWSSPTGLTTSCGGVSRSGRCTFAYSLRHFTGRSGVGRWVQGPLYGRYLVPVADQPENLPARHRHVIPGQQCNCNAYSKSIQLPLAFIVLALRLR